MAARVVAGVSASSPPAVTPSAPAGPPTTSGCTTQGPSGSAALVGDLTVAFNAMELPANPGQLTLTIYTGQPGSPTEEKHSLLAS